MADLRGEWLASLKGALAHYGLLARLLEELPPATQRLLGSASQGWHDVCHEVEIYEALFLTRGQATCRTVARLAVRTAMTTSFQPALTSIRNLAGTSPAAGFQHLALLWKAGYRDSGRFACASSTNRHAITELSGFPYGWSRGWLQNWLSLHEALLRELGYAGQSDLEGSHHDRFLVRTTWAGAVSPSTFMPAVVPSNGSGDRKA